MHLGGVVGCGEELDVRGESYAFVRCVVSVIDEEVCIFHCGRKVNIRIGEGEGRKRTELHSQNHIDVGTSRTTRNGLELSNPHQPSIS